MTATVIIITVIALFLLIQWIGKNKFGTMTLYHSSFLRKKKEGDTLRNCYQFALQNISHHQPVSELSDEEFRLVVDVMSKFDDPLQSSALLEHALKTGKIEYLREPYLSKLIDIGMKKGLIT
jgi:hypothetical protein